MISRLSSEIINYLTSKKLLHLKKSANILSRKKTRFSKFATLLSEEKISINNFNQYHINE